jgi:hypothetical protein
MTDVAGMHQRLARRHGVTGRLSTLRSAVVLWLLVVAAAQGVIAQGHVHFRFPHSTAASAALGYASATQDDRGTPGDRASGDPSTCALCQALAGGAVPLSPPLRYASPLAAFEYVALADSAEPEFVGAVSHIWTSRGPPSV